MKQIFYLLSFLVATSCEPSNSGQKITTNNDSMATRNEAKTKSGPGEGIQDDFRKQTLIGFEKASIFKLTDTIIADFNGDGIIDKAIYKIENETSGIIIQHGQTHQTLRIGFGKAFAHFTEFNWVDYWGLVEDKETSETTFSEEGDVLGSREVKLQNPAIVLGADEIGGGLITFRNGKYEWIHQTC